MRRAGGFVWGMAWGALLVVLGVAASCVLASPRIEALRTPEELGAELALWVFVAVGQEIAFRGVLLRLLLARRVGVPVAVGLSSAAFGAFHLIQPHATPWAAIALGLESVAAFALPYLLSRNLWIPIGAHFAWNAAEASVLGLTDSGVASYTGVLPIHIEGPDWATGGAFGLEASLPMVVVCLACGVVLLLRRGQALVEATTRR